MSQIRPGLECSTAMLKRLDAVVAGMNAAAPEGAPRHSRQSVLEGVEQHQLDAALVALEKGEALPAAAAETEADDATPSRGKGSRKRTGRKGATK